MSPPSQPEEAITRRDEPLGASPSGATTKEVEAAGEAHITVESGDVTESNGSRQEPVKASEELIDIGSAWKGFVNVEGQSTEAQHGPGIMEEVSEPESTKEEQVPPSHDPMESSTATLKPEGKQPSKAPPSLNLSPDEQAYLDPTPKTPLPSQPPSRSTSSAASIPHYSRAEAPERSPTRSDAGFDDKVSASEDEREVGSRSEIQSIMDQFSEEGQGPGHEEIMSPRLEFAGPLLGGPIQHPPRKSSLEPLSSSAAGASQGLQELRLSSTTSLNHQPRDESDIGPPPPPKPGSIHSFTQSRNQDDRYQSADSQISPPMHRPPPPEPEPEPDLPFDFHRFLEQLRHKTADPVAKFLRSFLQEFGKKQWMVHEQVKIIGDFLAFITNKMGQCDVWREVSDAEFDNAREGMEKLVMNRLYTQTFSPAIPPPQPIPSSKPRRRGAERLMGPGRRGQHQEDVERDDILAQKVSIYGWIKEEHLDIAPVGDSGKRFLVLAQQGICAINRC
jgi:Rab5 GDP/GTP exchange factor